MKIRRGGALWATPSSGRVTRQTSSGRGLISNAESRNVNEENVLDEMMQITNVSQWAYRLLVKKCTVLPESRQQKWAVELSLSPDFDWSAAYRAVHEKWCDNNVKWTQLRILHRILATKKYLKLWKIITDDKCTFCGTYTETIQHIFAHCAIIKHFWEIIARMFKLTRVNPQSIIIGYHGNSYEKRKQNLITLLGKHYIWCCAKSETRPSINFFCEFVRRKYEVQAGVVKLIGSHKDFEKLWVPLYRALPRNRRATYCGRQTTWDATSSQ